MGKESNIEWTDLSATGRTLGAHKSAARKTGCTVEEWMMLRRAGMKWCFRCRQWKHREQFRTDRSRGSGAASQCKSCQTRASIASLHGTKFKVIDDLLKKPCAICGRTKQKMAIDHCHLTGKIRAALCTRCNVGLGQFEDDPDLMRKAIAYLEAHNGKDH
jgi:hypothetical protein